MSLHQAPHLIERGIPPTIAATIVSAFSLAGALSSVLFGYLGDRVPVRGALAASAALLALGAVTMRDIGGPLPGYVSAVLFGAGIGGILTMIPVAWASYFGRAHFGAIRGITLPAQVGGQANRTPRRRGAPRCDGQLREWPHRVRGALDACRGVGRWSHAHPNGIARGSERLGPTADPGRVVACCETRDAHPARHCHVTREPFQSRRRVASRTIRRKPCRARLELGRGVTQGSRIEDEFADRDMDHDRKR